MGLFKKKKSDLPTPEPVDAYVDSGREEAPLGEPPSPAMSDSEKLEQALQNQQIISQNQQLIMQALEGLYQEMLRLAGEEGTEEYSDKKPGKKPSKKSAKKQKKKE